MSDIPAPTDRRTEIPLFRMKEQRPIGSLTIFRTETWQFYREVGIRDAALEKLEPPICNLTKPDGEQKGGNRVAASADLEPAAE